MGHTAMKSAGRFEDEKREPQPVMCSECLHKWTGFYLPLPIQDAARVMKNLTCPNCAAPSSKIYVGNGPKQKRTGPMKTAAPK